MSDPLAPLALSNNFLTFVFQDENANPINNGTVVVTLVDPDGTIRLSQASVPYVNPSHGLYRYQTAPGDNPVPGTYTVTWHAVDGRGVIFHHVESFVVVQ